MRQTLSIMIAGLLLTGTVNLALAQDPAQTETGKKETVRRKRMENQQKRIREGVKDGELTRKEAVKLEAKEAALAREARKDRKDGEGMTAKEKAKINAKQNKLSEEIYKEKHDAQKKK